MKTQNRKIAWITGGGTGIGKELTRILVNNKWHVIISGRRLKKINQTKSLNTKNITALQLDISSEKQCKKIVQTINLSQFLIITFGGLKQKENLMSY